MQVRLQSKTGPRLPSQEDLFRSFREQTEAAQQQWQKRLEHDPASFAQLEGEIHDHFRHFDDLMTARLLDQARPGKKGVPHPPNPRDEPRNHGR
jgi:hypothetical protein